MRCTSHRGSAQSIVSSLALVLALVAGSAARADTYVHNAWGITNLIFGPGCAAPFNALQLNATRGPTDGTPPFRGNLIFAQDDLIYTTSVFNCIESSTWTSNGTGRRAAKITGVYENPNPTSIDDLYLPISRVITLRDLTLDNVDLDYDNEQLNLRPVSGNSSLTLRNGSLTGLNMPGFKVDAAFALTASGNSSIGGWTGSVASATTLNVQPGGTLTFDNCGDQSQTPVTKSLYFNNDLGNTATADGGTLRLLTSWLTFGKQAVDPSHLSNMTFQNNAALELTGDRSKFEADNLTFVNSALRVAGHQVKSRGIVTLNSASVSVDQAGKLTSEALDVFGNSSFALGKEFKVGDYLASTGMAVLEPNSILTLNGEGSLAVTFQLRYSVAGPGQQYAQVVVNDTAALVSSGAIFDILPAASITISRTGDSVAGRLVVRDGGTLDLRASAASPNHFVNHGLIDIENGGLEALGPVTIQGGTEGSIDADSEGEISIGAFGGSPLAATDSLTTGNNVNMWQFSTLSLTLDPTARGCGRLRTTGNFLLGALTNLHVFLLNDSVAALGTKFTLVDYGTFAGIGVPGQWHFNGYPNGSIFKLGLNHYQINYKDAGAPGYNGAITLTVVPAPPPAASLSPATQTVNGTVGVNLAPSATMIPTGFGGTVTYSITPGLPAGLRFDLVTGAISGYPTTALSSTTFTIRGTGSTSGTATATVTLAIAKGSQTITFGPAPTPTYSSGGGFHVSASASSGLPVVFSSLTPAVCNAGGGNTVVILTAGTCTIAANQAGDANYGAAPQVTQAITIAKASPLPLTLFADPASIAAGGGAGGTSTLTTAGGSGTGAITFVVTGGPCTVSPPNSLTSSATGSCTVEARQAADPGYNAGTSNPVAVQVGPGAQAPLVLTATPTTFNVNGTSALSTRGGSGNGAVTFAVTSGPCTMLDATTVKGTAAGSCQVVATKAAEGTFGPATSIPVTLTVNRLAPPALVLTATPVAVGFGGSSTLGTTGGIPGAPVSYAVSGPCSVSGNTLVGTAGGACVVSATQAETSTYGAATSTPVTVTVKERTTTFGYPHATVTVGQPLVLAPVLAGFTSPVFAVLNGTLPAGLTLNTATGVISGVPTGPAGTFDAVITAFENNAYDAALAVVDVQATTEVPTLSEWGLLILALGLALAGMRLVRGGA